MRSALALTDPAIPAPALAAAPASKSLLRFITCGSVDDGKSTLLGRLLFETNSIFEDQAEALERDSARFGTTGKSVDYALLVDGLSAEREQGITIDVAYRYFSTPRRSFIAADTPGHEQYTRNMATGASTADCAIILIDARKGLLPQTRRHSYIVSMLGVRSVIVAVNKMDLVDYSEETFRKIEADYRALIPTLGFTDVRIIPLAAREGDNLAARSARMPWYDGAPLLEVLETIEPAPRSDASFRLPVQWVNRPDADFRGYSGTIAGGAIHVGDPVKVLPRGAESRIARILTPAGDAQEAGAGEAVTVMLASEIDVSRGDVVVAAGANLVATRRFEARLLALSESGVTMGASTLIKIGHALTRARVARVEHGIDINTYSEAPLGEIALNGLARVTIETETPLHAAPYAESAALGSLLLIDPITNATLALGVVETVATPERARLDAEEESPLARGIRWLFPAPDGDLARAISGRAVSAALLGLVIGLGSGSAGLGIGLALADLLLRNPLRRAHDRAWLAIRAARKRREAEALSLDGGGI